MARITTDATYSPREIANQLRNAVIAAARPRSGPIEDPVRLRQIRAFSSGITEALKQFVEDGDLRSVEELVLALTSAAWAAHVALLVRE